METEKAIEATESEPGTVRIPAAQFIEDVGVFLRDKSTEDAISELNQNYQVYKMVEQRLLQQRARLLSKLPDIKRALEVIALLKTKREEEQSATFDFQLAEQVYARAKVHPAESVNIWLGANVMLEYKLDEAYELLETNLANCQSQLKTNKQETELIKDYTTTTEVSIARVYNYDIAHRKASS